jgi:Ca-activated chloride channel family protein
MAALFRKLESPALTDLQLEVPGAAQLEAFPSPLPDLYVGEPVLVAFRAAALTPHAILRGRAGGVPWEREVFLEPVTAGAGLGTHWARAKVAALRDARRSGDAEGAIRRAVVEVALAHRLVSPYTSLVAVDVTPARPEDAELRTHALETMLPDGWSYTAVLGTGQGATAGPLHVALGLGALKGNLRRAVDPRGVCR